MDAAVRTRETMPVARFLEMMPLSIKVCSMSVLVRYTRSWACTGRSEIEGTATTYNSTRTRPKPHALLRYLVGRPGRLLSKDELIRAIWGPVVVTDDSLVQCVGELRAALGDREQKLIKTLPRRGYMLDTSIDTSIDTSSDSVAPRVAEPAAAPGGKVPVRWWLWPGIGALAVGAAGAAWQMQMRAQPPLRIDDEIAARRAVAVLTLVDADEPSGVSVLGNALADDIGTQVSLRQGMRVIGRSATARYDAAAPDAERIGRELKVRYVLSGRVVRDGGRIAVDSQLTSVATGEVLRLNRSDYATESDALRSNFGQRIASALRVQYYEIESARASQPGHQPDAVDLTLMGWRDLNRFNTRDDLLRGRSRFEAALRVDARSVMAAQGLGVSHLLELGSSMSPTPQRQLDLCEQALRHALQLGPDVPENLAAWGDVLVLRGQAGAALGVYNKALAINPSYAHGHLRLAHALIRQGRVDEALQHIDKARGLGPGDMRLLHTLYGLSAEAAFVQGRDAEAAGQLQQWAAEYPNHGRPYAMLAAIEALQGRDAEAAVHMTKHRELLPGNTVAYFLLTNPSDDPGYLRQRARLVEGLRKAGLPER
jgi:adenylate cyclase